MIACKPKTVFAELLGAITNRYPHEIRLRDRVLCIRAVTPDLVLYDAYERNGETLMPDGRDRAMTPRGFVRSLAMRTETAFG